MAKYLYFALFELESNGQVLIEFPDLPGCISCGDDISNALYMAKDALEGYLLVLEDEREEIPVPTKATELKVPVGKMAVPIEVNTDLVRLQLENKAVKKTLTIPQWLDELAKEKNVNFSHVLQDALKRHLGIEDKKVM